MYLTAGDDRNFAPGLKALAEQAAPGYEGRFLLELIQTYDAHSSEALDGRILVSLGDD